MDTLDDLTPVTPRDPLTELDPRYSSPDAAATPWSDAVAAMDAAGAFWLTTVRPDSRPHVTPLLAVWSRGALHFCTGPAERKALNLESNSHVVLTTGSQALDAGLDIVVEGAAARVVDDAELHRLADLWEAKYGREWRFEVRDGDFHHDEGGNACVFAVRPATAFGFAKSPYGQTRWRFPTD